MARVKRGFTAHRRHKKVLRMVKGHMTSRGHLFKTAHQEMMKSLMYAYRDRRTRKRDMRKLWIVRINAAARMHGLPYNRFIAGLNGLGLGLDRKMLAEMAVNDPHGFAVIAARIKGEPEPTRLKAIRGWIVALGLVIGAVAGYHVLVEPAPWPVLHAAGPPDPNEVAALKETIIRSYEVQQTAVQTGDTTPLATAYTNDPAVSL